MSDIRGKGPDLKPRHVRVDRFGAVFARQPYLEYISTEQVTSTAATAKSLTVPPDADFGYIQVTAAPIYWAFNPLNPTPSSSIGADAAVGQDIYLNSHKLLVDFRAVRNGSANFTLKVLYFRKAVSDVY